MYAAERCIYLVLDTTAKTSEPTSSGNTHGFLIQSSPPRGSFSFQDVHKCLGLSLSIRPLYPLACATRFWMTLTCETPPDCCCCGSCCCCRYCCCCCCAGAPGGGGGIAAPCWGSCLLRAATTVRRSLRLVAAVLLGQLWPGTRLELGVGGRRGWHCRRRSVTRLPGWGTPTAVHRLAIARVCSLPKNRSIPRRYFAMQLFQAASTLHFFSLVLWFHAHQPSVLQKHSDAVPTKTARSSNSETPPQTTDSNVY